MRIISIDKETVLFSDIQNTVGKTVQAAIHKNADLSHADLRGACLRYKNLDGACLRRACLWGADLTGANLSGADLTGADMRTAILKDCCLAESRCNNVNFSGAYFNNTIIVQSDFTQAVFSCPSVFSLPLWETAQLKGAIYMHRGETPCPLDRPPLIISGAEGRIIDLGAYILFGQELITLDKTTLAQP